MPRAATAVPAGHPPLVVEADSRSSVVSEPHVAKAVAVRAGLSEAADIVVSELHAAGQRVPVAVVEAGLVGDHVVACRPAARENRVAAICGAGSAERIAAALSCRRKAALDFSVI